MPDQNIVPEVLKQTFQGNSESRKANRLYWDTDESVNGIAERLQLSKGRLYDMITSLAVEAECPRCGENLVYANRTARDHGVLTCESCGFEGSRSDVDGDSTPGRHPASRLSGRALLTSDRAMVGAVLAGVAVGLMVGRWLK